MIYDVVLRNDKELHNRIKIDLQAILTEGLFSYGIKNRQEYYTMFKEKFYDKFSKTNDMNKSLRFAFWSTLAVKYPDWIILREFADTLNDNYLFRIFRYTYNAIETKYKEYIAIMQDKEDKNFEYKQLKEYIKWLQSQIDYKDFDKWCRRLVDNKFFTLNRLFYELDSGLFCSFTYTSIQKIISSIYQLFKYEILDSLMGNEYIDKDVIEFMSPEIIDFQMLVDVYITDDKYSSITL